MHFVLMSLTPCLCSFCLFCPAAAPDLSAVLPVLHSSCPGLNTMRHPWMLLMVCIMCVTVGVQGLFKAPKPDVQQSGVEASCGAALKDILVRVYRSSNSEAVKPWRQQLHQALETMGAEAAAASALRHLERQAARWDWIWELVCLDRGWGRMSMGGECCHWHCMLWAGVQEWGCLKILSGLKEKGFAAHSGTLSVLVTHGINTSDRQSDGQDTPYVTTQPTSVKPECNRSGMLQQQ